MMNRNHMFRMKNILLLVSLLPVVALPGIARGADGRTEKGYFSQLLDGDIRLAPIGNRADLHMTFLAPTNTADAYTAVHADRPDGSNSGIHLSVRLPLK